MLRSAAVLCGLALAALVLALQTAPRLTFDGAPRLSAQPSAAPVTVTDPAAAMESGGPFARDKVYEIRTYTTHPGRLDALLRRFRDHTTHLFEKHGMENVGYWVPQDEPLARNTVIYILAHPDREAAGAAWRAFAQDPEWHEVRDASEVDGPVVASLERTYMDPTDFSRLR